MSDLPCPNCHQSDWQASVAHFLTGGQTSADLVLTCQTCGKQGEFVIPLDEHGGASTNGIKTNIPELVATHRMTNGWMVGLPNVIAFLQDCVADMDATLTTNPTLAGTDLHDFLFKLCAAQHVVALTVTGRA